MVKCEHEVPCTCPEYLNRLNTVELENLKIQFGNVGKKATILQKIRAKQDVAKVNAILKLRKNKV